tara:strand:+ start:114 stop:1226 length:1113 start_codon:yes stop_codon:yes gene_type:complete
MSNEKTEKFQIEISIIGCGIAGITTAYHLAKQGYKINIIDPKIHSEINNLNPNNGTQASLGVLMGNSYQKSKGRSFFLRNKSMKLWKEWVKELNYLDGKLKFEKPLIKLATSKKEYQSMINVIKNKKLYTITPLDKNSIEKWSILFEKKLIGGLISYEDGRLNPIKLMKAFMQKINSMKVNKINDSVNNIQRNSNLLNKKWTLSFNENNEIHQDFIIICSSLNSQKLLKLVGHEIFLEPILGQAVELELTNKNKEWDKWPAVVNYQSINFIHPTPSKILIGATLEPGSKPNALARKQMLTINDTAPAWIKEAKIIHQWNGLRARPLNEPAPILKELEPGLLINTGHYRNGILLAPACAEWIGDKIDNYIF